KERNIVYAPDYVVNCGGVINVADELQGYNKERAKAKVQGVYDQMDKIFNIATRDGVTPAVAADRLAEERIDSMLSVKSTSSKNEITPLSRRYPPLMQYNILVLNLGSTSTKIAIYNNLTNIAEDTLSHPAEQTVKPMPEQIEYRLDAILSFLDGQKFDPSSIDIVSARGGTLRPIEGGTYNISPQMVSDLSESTYGRHASNMSGLIADRFRKKYGCEAVITDPVVVDELIDEVRMTG